jgi:LacI family transcriptional regulator
LKIRIKDIADRAGVSTGTVDRVIHERGEVSPKTRERVLNILNEMHYEPDILARSLASKRLLKIAVLIPYHTPENGFWKEPLAGISDACSELDHFGIEVREFLYNQFTEEEFLDQVREIFEFVPDAIIAAPVFHQETKDLFDRCSEHGIPFVSLNDNIHHPDQITYIGQDPRRSGAVAAQLLKMGMRGEGKVMVVSIARDRDNYSHIQNREEGFRAYWKGPGGNGSRDVLSLVIPSESSVYIKKILAEQYGRCPDISGIFVTNSRVYQVARFLVESGRGNTMLVGYDLINPNIRYLNNGTIDFLISQKPREQGYRALMSVFNVLKVNKKPSPEQHIPIDIICRENLCCYQV